MESAVSALGSWYVIVGGVAVTSIVVFKLRGYCKKREATVYPDNVVILHQYGRGLYLPHSSPFCLKLETYLRMAKIPYQCHFGNQRSAKGKSPWITYNGEDVADSQFCIEYLNKKFEVDLNVSLTEKDKAVALAFRKLLEDNFYWCLALWRWIYDPQWGDLRKAIAVPFPILVVIMRMVKKQAYGHGIGRHSQEEVMTIAEADMRALSDFLGNKKFFMGDAPTEIDACVFGSVAQIKWQMARSPCEKLLRDQLGNLSTYCDRMKELYWPDWDDCHRHGGSKVPTA